MMSRRRDLAIDALSKALKLRMRLGIPLTDSLSPIDAAEKIGIEVRFVDLPSMEGIYVAGEEPKILLSSLRPQGRKMFTCAHEIGHHMYGHGDKFDEIRTTGNKLGRQHDNEQEFVADCFAAYFLMPKATIDHGLRVRELSYQNLDPVAVFTLSCWLGVGYHTLVTHLLVGLRAITRKTSDELSAVNPQDIRRQILNGTASTQVYMVDANWVGRAIDCEVNDVLVVPEDTTYESPRLKKQSASLIQAIEPGLDRLSLEKKKWSAFVRIAPQEYVGRSCFRFEETSE